MIVAVPRDAPVVIHWQITTKCNLACPKCFYRGTGEISGSKAIALVDEWAAAGVKSIAIGGGEPMLVPWLGTVVKFAKQRGLYVAVTTNGTVLRDDVPADRVAISYDKLHVETWSRGRRVIEHAVSHYRWLGANVSLNHVLIDEESFDLVDAYAIGKKGCQLVVLLEKPKSEFCFRDGAKERLKKHAVDACLAKVVFGKECNQGLTSMFVSVNLEAAVCSNVKARVPYTTLKETWASLPKECLYEGVTCEAG